MLLATLGGMDGTVLPTSLAVFPFIETYREERVLSDGSMLYACIEVKGSCGVSTTEELRSRFIA